MAIPLVARLSETPVSSNPAWTAAIALPVSRRGRGSELVARSDTATFSLQYRHAGRQPVTPSERMIMPDDGVGAMNNAGRHRLIAVFASLLLASLLSAQPDQPPKVSPSVATAGRGSAWVGHGARASVFLIRHLYHQVELNLPLGCSRSIRPPLRPLPGSSVGGLNPGRRN